ncbi:MAG: tetratricopeptide repeat protein [Herminiimonas sp.]|nr:tetratricopeptide repeat protein [Herminiimonas sp.]
MRTFTVADLESRYGILRRLITSLVKDGFVMPSRGPRREYRFSFHDVVILRMAQDLVTAGVPAARAVRFLGSLRRNLPVASAIGTRVVAAGREMVVREDGRLRNEDGQLVIDFMERSTSEGARPSRLPEPARASGPKPSKLDDAAAQRETPAKKSMPVKDADYWFNSAGRLEESDPLQAILHYRKAIALRAGFADAWINLGVLLLEGRQVLEAVVVYEEAVAHCRTSPLLYFNLGVAREELKQLDKALRAYAEAIRLDPEFADAYFNAGRLHEMLGHKTAAIRHFSQYRRLART